MKRPNAASVKNFHLLICVIWSLSACSTQAPAVLTEGASIPRSVAVLPVQFDSDIPRERANYLHQALSAELKNRNFIVLDPTVVKTVCTEDGCPRKGELASKYPVDGFVALKLDSFSKNSFVAGYYNTLSGTLTVTDRAGKPITTTEHTANESGGVLLQSGQVIQGIIDQVEHSGDKVFYNLADKFASGLTARLPQPNASSSQPGASGNTPVTISDIRVTWPRKEVFEVCASATPNSFASLTAGKRKSELRERSPGSYCGAFNVETLLPDAQPLALEVKTAFGSAVRKELTVPAKLPCDLTGKTALRETEKGAEFAITCTETAPGSVCVDATTNCEVSKVLVYRSASPLGPYMKVGEAKSVSTVIPGASGSTSNVYQVLAANGRGTLSRPVSPAVGSGG